MKKSLLLHVFGKPHGMGTVVTVAVVVQTCDAVVGLAKVAVVSPCGEITSYRATENVIVVIGFLYAVVVSYGTGTA